MADTKPEKMVILSTTGKTKEQIAEELIALAKKAGILKPKPGAWVEGTV